MANYTLTAQLRANSSDFESGMKRAEASIANLQTKFESSMNKLSKTGDNIKNLGNGLTNWITKPALGAATAVGGIAIAGGFKRLVDIDTASAKLKGLGYTAEEISGKSGIMDNALDSVRGTAFGMGDAVTTAAGAIAAGVKPGKELTRYLSLTGDTAAIAGAGMNEIGSIMNKVTTSNKAYNNELGMLSDRGLPVYQWLAEAAGVTTDEITKMASEGKISSEMLLNAIETNIGGAAQIMGMESFSAAIANTWAAVSRLGAAFLDGGNGVDGFFSKLKPLIGGVAKLDENGNILRDTNGKIIMESEGLIQKIDKLAPMATELGNKFADGFQKILDFVSETKAKFDGLSAPVQDFILKATAIGTAVAVGIGPALKVIGSLLSYAKFLTPVFTALTGPIGIAVGVIALLAGGFMLAWKHSETFRNGVMGLIDTFQNVFSSVGAVVLPLLQQIGQYFVQLGKSIVESVAPHLDTLSMAFTSFIGNITPIIMSIVANVIPIFTQLGSAIMSIAQAVLPVLMSMFVQLIPIVLSLVETIFMIIGAMMPTISMLVGAIVPVIVTIVGLLMNIISSVFPLLVMAIQIIIDAIQTIIPIIAATRMYMALLISGIMAFANVVISIIGLLISTLMLVITPIVGFVLTIISSIISIIKTVVGAVTSVFNTVFSIVSNIFSSIGAFIANTISTAISVISTITGHVSSIFNTVYQIISGVFDNVASKIQTVMAAIQGAWSGLTAFTAGVFDGVYSAVQSLVSRVTSLVNSVIGGINSAIGIINKIPGVSIGSIPYLYRGTDNWKGGAARMNEGGRGEIVILPSGSQVIPHDVSMKYAKESARNMMQNRETHGDFGAQSVQHELKVRVVPDADWIRGYIDEQNAIEATLQF